MTPAAASLLPLLLLASPGVQPSAVSSPAEGCDALLAACARSVPGELGEVLERLDGCREDARRAGDLAREAESLRLQAVLRGFQGRWRESLRTAERAVAVAARTRDPATNARALLALGDAQFYLWRFDAASRSFEEAVALYRRAGDPLGEAHALKDLGIAQVPRGRRDLAILHLERAMERYPEWRDDELAVSILGNLGTIYSKLGAPRSALRTLERTLEIARNRGRPDEMSDVLGRLAYLHLRLGRPEEALAHFEEALAAAREAGPAADLPLLEGIASAHEELGDHEAAEAAVRRLLDQHRRLGNRIGTCFALAGLARFAEADDPERSQAMYREAEALATEASLDCRREALAGRARIASRLGDRDGAVATLFEALSAVESRGEELVSDFDRTTLAESTETLFRSLAGLLIDRAREDGDGSDRERAFHVLERMRASALTRGIAEARLPPPRGLPGARQRHLARLEREILSLRERIGALDPEAAERSELRSLLGLREAELDEHRKNARRAAARRPPPPATAPALRERLPSGTALVSYLVGEDGSFAFVVTPDGFRLVELPAPRARLEEQIAGFLDLLGDRRHPGWATVGHRLYRDLVMPWQDTLGPGVETVVIVPDRELRSIPFEALPRDADGRRFLVQDFAVAYAPSATALLDLTARAASGIGGEPAPGTDLLVLSDPRTAAGGDGARPLRALFEEDGHDLSPMPFGRLEGSRIARHVRGSVTLAGTEATEARAKAADLSHYGVLHFATHGLLSQGDPRRSALLLGVDPEGREDGFLQAREIELLRLDADLVVLSACRTARGRRIGGGAGVESLAEAFFLAGARSVIGTLWNVEDRAAMDLMTAFYRHLGEGRSKAEALRDAKIGALAAGSPPSDWAGFVLLGAPFDRVEVVKPRSRKVLFSAGLLLVTAALSASLVRWKRCRPPRGERT